jgi:tetratricopeptide (TPR) repeat protein
MSKRVGSRLVPWALLTAALAAGGLTATPCGADLMQTTDGKWYPPTDPSLGPTDEPGDEALAQTADHKLDATYETVKLAGPKGTTKPAGQVAKLVASGRSGAEYRQANADAESGFWREAADGFAAAAEAGQGFAKHAAMWDRVLALSEGAFFDEMARATDELLQAYPKSYYFADAHVLRAKVAAAQGKVADAGKALDAIKAAPGMNPRDLFRAEYWRVFLTLDAQRKSDEALKGYQDLVAAIDRGDAAMGETTRMLALVGLGNMQVAKGNPKDATTSFTKATESKNPTVLAGAYAGLGDIAFGEAKQLRDAKDLEGAKKKLETAVLHYLRVTQFYRTEATELDAVLRALGNQAKAFTVLFDMTKEHETGKRAWLAYKQFDELLADGPAKKQARRDWQDFDKRFKEFEASLKGKPPTPPADKPK